MTCKPFKGSPRLSLKASPRHEDRRFEGQVDGHMHDWSFSDTAEWVVGVLLAAAIVATVFV
jgi:hypothetical protein